MASLSPTNRGNAASASVIDFGTVKLYNNMRVPNVSSFPCIMKDNLDGVTQFTYFFANNKHIREIRFGKDAFELSVLSIKGIASDCENLEVLILPEVMTYVNDISSILQCTTTTNKVKECVVPDAPRVNIANSMFYGCKNLEKATIGDIGTSATSVRVDYMFYKCENLETLSIGDISRANNTAGLLWGCNKLTDFSVKALPDTNMTNNEFSSCSSLSAQSYANILAALPNTPNGSTIQFNKLFNDLVADKSVQYKARDIVTGTDITQTLEDWANNATINKGWIITTL